MSNEVLVQGGTKEFEEFKKLALGDLGLGLSDFNKVDEVLKKMGKDSLYNFGGEIGGVSKKSHDTLLDMVKASDLEGEVQQKITSVVKMAKDNNNSGIIGAQRNSNFMKRMWHKIMGVKDNFTEKFDTINDQMDSLVREIEISQKGLIDRVDLLNSMEAGVMGEYRQLGVYIAAGKIKEIELQKEINMLAEGEVGRSVVSEELYKLNSLANNLNKRLHDLELLQHNMLQTIPMISVIRSNNSALIEKFYAIKNVTIPAWKNQHSLAITLEEQKSSVELTKAIDDTTNSLLVKNAKLLHENSVKTAQSGQRSVIDVETLEQVQGVLVKTLSDVIAIQAQGAKDRAETTEKLRKLRTNFGSLIADSIQTEKPDQLH